MQSKYRGSVLQDMDDDYDDDDDDGIGGGSGIVGGGGWCWVGRVMLKLRRPQHRHPRRGSYDVT